MKPGALSSRGSPDEVSGRIELKSRRETTEIEKILGVRVDRGDS